ncbi:MAG: glutamine--fructose-6-phosphate transaminase (isomerizing) [Clostridiales bacterium]|nr:glutamine--fructose-6-phosphate transaminase (isomerizing) [Clostridiales bacterium]
MCGIVGFVGSGVDSVLINKLKDLEYRGYDSAGMALSNVKKVKVFKAKGEIFNLEKKIKPLRKACLGIAHTRWATHGRPDEINAHPHYSKSKKWFVVHNGIIENYALLKNVLLKKGYDFYSNTDTEIIAKLFDEYTYSDDFKTFESVVKCLRGSFAIAVIKKGSNKIFFAKNKSPLYIAKSEKSVMIASDVACFCGFSDNYVEINDGEYGYVFEGEIFVKNKRCEVQKILKDLSVSDYVCRDGASHNMIREIFETKDCIKSILEKYSDCSGYLSLLKSNPNKIKSIKIVGCGTAYNSSLIGADILKNQLNIDCTAVIASEFRYNPPYFDKNTLFIFVSQSGETADTISAFDFAKQNGVFSIGIINVSHSTLAKKVDVFFPTCAGREIAVASTKAYSCQIVVFKVIAKLLKFYLKNEKYDLTDIKSLYEDLSFGDCKLERQVADIVKKKDKLFMIGRGLDYYTALETSLKIKETCYVNCDTYYAGELKHGFLALIENDFLVVVFATQKTIFEKTLSNAEEAYSRGAKLILFTCFEVDDITAQKFYKIIKVPSVNSELQTVLNIVPWQLIAYYTSTAKGINPDKPRNLAKSVTVE